MLEMSMRKRPLKETDHALLKRKLCNAPGMIGLDEADLDILQSGETAFLWESSLAMSTEETMNMARLAASKMAPAPGRVILAAVLYVIMGSELEVSLDTVGMISDTIQPMISKDGVLIFGTGFCDEKGIRFLLATSEGSAKEETL